MNHIRFSCPLCGQHLACEAPSLGTRIQCPACKRGMVVPSEPIVRCYGLLDLLPGTPLAEVKQVHAGLLKPLEAAAASGDAQLQKTAREKATELNEALRRISAYLAGSSSEVRATAPATAPPAREEAKPREDRAPVEQESRPKAPPPAEKRSEPKPAQTAASHPALAAGKQEGRRPMMWMMVGAGVTVALAVVIGICLFFFVIRQGPPLSDQSTAANWIRASIKTKRAYCRAILFEMEHQQMPRKLGLRVTEDFFYEGLETICRQQEPADLNVTLVDLCTKMMAEKAAATAKSRAGDSN